MISYRCRRTVNGVACDKRKSFTKRHELYKRIPACPNCGSRTNWVIPKDRLRSVRAKKEQCRCDAYHFPHCKGKGDCNPANVERKRKEHEERWPGFESNTTSRTK